MSKASTSTLFFPSIIVLLAITLKTLYSMPLWDTLVFTVALFFCFFIPGDLLKKLLFRSGANHVAGMIESMAIGVALVPVIYINFRRLGHPEGMGWALLLMLVLWGLCTWRYKPSVRQEVKPRHNSKEYVDLIVILTCSLILLHFSHFSDVKLLDDGFKIRTTYLTETIFHHGLINALKDGFPPPSLFFSGGPNMSSYHLNMHVEIELVNRIFSIETLKLSYFFFPLLYFSLIIFVPYLFFLSGFNSRTVGLLSGLFLFFSDLSFIPGLLGIAGPDYPWALFFIPTVWSLFTLNGYIPAIFILYFSIFYLWRFFEQRKVANILLFALMAFASVGFKTSMGLQIAAVSLLTGVFLMSTKKDRAVGTIVFTVSAILLLLMLLEIKILRNGIGLNIISFAPLNNYNKSLTSLNLTSINVYLFPLLFAVYTVATFGARFLGLFYIKKIYSYFGNPCVFFLVIFSTTGFALSELFFLGTDNSSINNAVWFASQSLCGSWLLVGLLLLHIQKKYGQRYFATVALLCLLLAVPTTFQFLTLRNNDHYITISTEAMSIVEALRELPIDSVVLHLPNDNGPSLASNFAGRSSVLNSFRSFVPLDIYQERSKDVNLFFNTKLSLPMANYFLKKYNVDYIYVPKYLHSTFIKYSLLSLKEENGSFSLFKVKGLE